MSISLESLIEPVIAVWQDLIALAPKLAASFAFLVAGLLLAWLLRLFALGICTALKIDTRCSEVWLFKLWSKGTHGHKPSRTISGFFYYLVLFIFVMLSVKVLGGDTSSKIIASMLDLIPRVFSFIMILFLGFLMAMFLSVVTQIILASSNIKYPNFWGKVIAWSTFGVAVIFSLEQLGIAGTLITSIILIALGCCGLAIAIAAGIGCKDIAREFVIDLLKKSKDKDSR
jgi:hypothetical protein